MRAHGTRAKYVHDRCRCDACVNANRAYASYQAKRKRLESLGRTDGPWAAPFVDATELRTRILAFSRLGVGYRRVAELAGVSRTSLMHVRSGRRDRVRRETADAVLALPLEPDVVADGQLVDAAPSWALVRQILRRKGWSKARISAEIGQAGRALQLGDRQITARNARAIAALAERLDIAGAADTRRFPLAPLLTGRSIAGLARDLGWTSDRQLHRWKGYGIPADRADEIACALGYHPAELWPDWYGETLPDEVAS